MWWKFLRDLHVSSGKWRWSELRGKVQFSGTSDKCFWKSFYCVSDTASSEDTNKGISVIWRFLPRTWELDRRFFCQINSCWGLIIIWRGTNYWVNATDCSTPGWAVALTGFLVFCLKCYAQPLGRISLILTNMRLMRVSSEENPSSGAF